MAAPGPAKRPGAQGTGSDAPAAQALPAGHGTQAPAPAADTNVPGAHAVQAPAAVRPRLPYVPTGQGTPAHEMLLAAAEKVPDAHGWHTASTGPTTEPS